MTNNQHTTTTTTTATTCTSNSVVPFRKRVGYLKKQGKGESMFGRKNWKKRWFVLDKGFLVYYESEHTCAAGFDPFGVLRLQRDDTVFVDKYSKKPFTFKVCTARRELYLSASSEREMMDWIDEINTQIMSSKRFKSQLVTSSEINQHMEPTNQSPTRSPKRFSQSPAHSPKKDAEKRLTYF